MAEIKKHEDTLDESSPRDYIDMYLIGMKTNKALTLEDLAVSLGDMFVAGTETSSTTLKWTLMYLCLHPDVQTKCREEIRRELDTERYIEASTTMMVTLMVRPRSYLFSPFMNTDA